ncbi:hypothetical protein LQ567_19195 [Niabella pedocola]|uniref:Uncharacterized protein n=1 Tax=Niabella pedocola TaxID=1752077 RepID=A0ABS8PV19_9BACT|nr:hypothetical protein [Niabella pedocola]MCD2424918.1 hypothetical protein [Niabella pedocola]
MDTKPGKTSFGILRNIRRLIFEDEHVETTGTPEPAPVTPVKKPEPVAVTPVVPVYVQPVHTETAQDTDLKEMKGKVLDLLEKLNEDGIDFFEVWNAAADMGTIDATSIKAAFTSLKYVDKSLTKEKLLKTGRNYAARIQEVIAQDVAQKENQKQGIQNNLVREKQSLEKEIQDLKTKIADLQQQLSAKEQSYKTLDGSYDSQLTDIDQKIRTGKAAVTEVVGDIEKALSIIEQNIN